MGTGTLSPSEIFQQRSEAAVGIEHHVPPIYIEAPLIYVLSHDCEAQVVPLIDDIAKDRAKGAPQGTHLPELDAHETFSQFAGKCEKAAHSAKHPKEQCIGADLPAGVTEPGLVLTLGQMTLQELQMIRNFAILSSDDKIFLLEHPEVIEKLASGQMVLESEGIRREIEEEMEKDLLGGSDRKMQRILVKAHDVFWHNHIILSECSDEEKVDEHFHPKETPLTDVVVAHAQEFDMPYDPSKDGEYSNN